MIRALIVALILMALSACSTPNPIYVVRCPALISYPQDVMTRAADELDAMPPSAVVRNMIADYATLRAKCRAIETK